MPGRGRTRRSTFLTDDAAQKRALYEELLATVAPNGRPIGSATRGVYAFFDFDLEPIYVGQTTEEVKTRLGRHMTGQRSDAVVNRVLDPMEVAYLEIYPLWDLEPILGRELRVLIDAAERTLFERVVADSRIGAVLNEKDPPPFLLGQAPYALRDGYRARLIPEESWERLAHRDERIARRASTLAALSNVIRERSVSLGLRRTQVRQARRLLNLAEVRYAEVTGELTPNEIVDETTGDDDA